MLRKDSLLSTLEQLKLCVCGCGELIPPINKRGEIAQFKHGHNRRGLASNWKGGRIVNSEGYIEIRCEGHHRAKKPGYYVMEHIDVWEREHNACLLWWSNVHHKDHNKQNNDPSNLVAMMVGNHTKLHKTRS